jgi:hypothetical protein
VNYYPIQQRWRRLGPIYRSPLAAAIWHPDMERYAQQRAADYGYPHQATPYQPGQLPQDYETCDWRWSGRRGPQPAYWGWVCHSACHWLAGLNLFVAQRAEPDREWRIVTSDRHSTVWDGADTLFDANFLALGIHPDEAWSLAGQRPDSEVLPIGQPLHTL